MTLFTLQRTDLFLIYPQRRTGQLIGMMSVSRAIMALGQYLRAKVLKCLNEEQGKSPYYRINTRSIYEEHSVYAYELIISQYFQNWFSNTPIPSSKNSHFQKVARYKTLHMKISISCMRLKNHFHSDSFALSLALKQNLVQLRNGLLSA